MRKEAKKSRDMIKNNQNMVAVTDAIRDYFQNPQSYAGDNEFLAPYANELIELTKLSGRSQSVSKLSMQARVALSKHLSQVLASKSYETGGTDANSVEKNKQIADGLASMLHALNQDQFNRYNEVELYNLHKKVKGIDSSILEGITSDEVQPFEFNGTKMSGSVVARDGDNNPTAWKLVDSDSKQVFFVKKHDSQEAADGEKRANAVSRMLGISGLPFIDTMDSGAYTVSTDPVTALNMADSDYKRLSSLPEGTKNSLSYDNLMGIMALDSLLGLNRTSAGVLVGKNHSMEGLPLGTDEWTAVPVGNMLSNAIFSPDAKSVEEYFSNPSLNNFSVDSAQDLLEKLGPVAFKAMMDKKIAQMLANIEAGMGGGYFSQAELDVLKLRAAQLSGFSPEKWAEILG
jgi:hypothetical protein